MACEGDVRGEEGEVAGRARSRLLAIVPPNLRSRVYDFILLAMQGEASELGRSRPALLEGLQCEAHGSDVSFHAQPR